jgi:hypothetical protein
MKTDILAIPVSLVLAATAAAQTETSPKGMLATEGSWVTSSRFGYYTTAYGYGTSFVQVDATNLGTPRTLQGLSVRRDGTRATSAEYVGRTVRFDVRMAHADWSKVKANISQTEGEVLLTPWTMVMTDKQVNLPDFTQKPASGTAPFTALLAFDSSFAYSGNAALAFQVRSSPSSSLATNFSEYPIDYEHNPSAQAQQSYYGTGCIVTGKSGPMSHNSQLGNYGPNSAAQWDLDTSSAPGNAPIVTVLGLANPDLAFGGCEKLYATLDVTLTGTTNANGFNSMRLTFPHRPEYVGAKVYSQSASFDAGKNAIVMSEGMDVVYPADPVQRAVACASTSMTWNPPYWPASHTFFRGTAIVFGLHE